MVLPKEVRRAAKRGQANIVAAWLESGGGINDRKPRAEILRLRSLALRRRAILTAPTRHDGQYIRSLSFVVRCPPEIAWHVLGYWRCQYPGWVDMIDLLGFH